MERFTCDWIFNSLVVLCDGTVVCGCADPAGERPLGHISTSPIREIWNSTLVHGIRDGLNHGFSPFCIPCGLKRELAHDAVIPQQAVHQDRLPRLFIEPTVLCNLACLGSVCSKESNLSRSRSQPMLSMDRFNAIINETGSDLTRVDLFNYGEPFVNPLTIDMIETIKARFPGILVYISTNGLMLTDPVIERIVLSGLDEITFSIDGTDQLSYQKYRKGGDFEKALSVMQKLVTLRDRLGRFAPIVNWRYILFKWNDSLLRMRDARRMAERAGVDRLVWEITDHPREARSWKYQPGRWFWRRVQHEIWDVSQLANAIPGKQYRAEIRLPVTQLRMASGLAHTIRVRIANRGGALWHQHTPEGRRTIRLGAQLLDTASQMIELNYARAFISNDLKLNDTATIDITLPGISTPGRYMLKFDMVCEGIEWFESVGSPTQICHLLVS